MPHKQTNNAKEKLIGLLEQSREEMLSESDRVKLNDLLRHNPELIDDLIEHQEQCAALRIMHLPCHEIPGKPLPFSIKNEELPVPTTVKTNSSWFGPHSFSKVAVSVLVLFAIAFGVGYTMISPNSHKKPMPVVARLVATNQCRWTSPKAPNLKLKTPQTGEMFRQGTMLKLESGLAQIEYESGVSILFQGPGQLELSEPNTVCLHSGVIISRVSPEAVGFTVNTPNSKVIDHGTEFAVGVDKDHKTEVSVLEGKVELKKRQSQSKPSSQMLTAGQALRLDTKGEIELFRTIDPSRLAKNLTESNEAKQHNARVAIYRLRSASELKLKGKLVRAINVGGNKGFQVGDIRFEPDDPFVLDSSKTLRGDWGNRPWLGNSADDKALCEILHSIRHNLAREGYPPDAFSGSRPVSARLLVEPGRYRIQLLISENFHVRDSRYETIDRSLNLDIEGVPCLRDLRVLATQGIAGHPVPPNQILLIDVELDVNDDDLYINLFSNKVPEKIDNNVILNGLVIERLDDQKTSLQK